MKTITTKKLGLKKISIATLTSNHMNTALGGLSDLCTTVTRKLTVCIVCQFQDPTSMPITVCDCIETYKANCRM